MGRIARGKGPLCRILIAAALAATVVLALILHRQSTEEFVSVAFPSPLHTPVKAGAAASTPSHPIDASIDTMRAPPAAAHVQPPPPPPVPTVQLNDALHPTPSHHVDAAVDVTPTPPNTAVQPSPPLLPVPPVPTTPPPTPPIRAEQRELDDEDEQRENKLALEKYFDKGLRILERAPPPRKLATIADTVQNIVHTARQSDIRAIHKASSYATADASPRAAALRELAR
jgi:hypothetical protein